MKKVLSIVIIVMLLFSGLFILTGCGDENGKGNNKLEPMKLSLQVDSLERTVSVNIGYPKDAGITVEDGNLNKIKTLKNEEKNYKLEFNLQNDSTYENNKKSESKKDNYTEVKFNDYSGYNVKASYNIKGRILLEDLSSQNIFIYLIYTLSPIKNSVNGEKVDIESLYNLDEVQTILKSIKYDKGEDTVEATKKAIEDEKEKIRTSNYGEFANRSREDGTSDKDGLIFIPSFKSPKTDLYKAEQKNDNVGIDNYLWYISKDKAYEASGIEVRVFPKADNYENLDKYKEKKGNMYNWSKATIAGKEYDVFTFGSNPTTPEKYSKYYSGAFMVGNKVIEFSYNMYKEIPDQDLGDTFFKQIIDSIEYSDKMKAK